MSGGIDDAQKMIGIANRLLTDTSIELNEPIKKCETALGILATALGIVDELQKTGNDIGIDLAVIFERVTSAEGHLTNSSMAQSLLGIDQPSSPGYQMSTETNTASSIVTELKADLNEGIETTTTRDANKFTYSKGSLQSIQAPLNVVLVQLKDAQEKNLDAVEAANAFMETT